MKIEVAQFGKWNACECFVSEMPHLLLCKGVSRYTRRFLWEVFREQKKERKKERINQSMGGLLAAAACCTERP